MNQLTLKQCIFLAIELRSKFLENVEAIDREHRMGHKYAAWLLDAIIKGSEESLQFDQVNRDLGYVMAILVERRSATPAELDLLVGKAKAFNMVISGQVNYASSVDALSMVATENQE